MCYQKVHKASEVLFGVSNRKTLEVMQCLAAVQLKSGYMAKEALKNFNFLLAAYQDKY